LIMAYPFYGFLPFFKGLGTPSVTIVQSEPESFKTGRNRTFPTE
jgi:hypothetical protein